jgi:hypothetical protein
MGLTKEETEELEKEIYHYTNISRNLHPPGGYQNFHRLGSSADKIMRTGGADAHIFFYSRGFDVHQTQKYTEIKRNIFF